MKVLERGIVLVCQATLWLTMALIFVILCANTLLRYTTGSSLQWGAELPELLFPWLVMAGVVLASEKGAHIATVFLVACRRASGLRPAMACSICRRAWPLWSKACICAR